MEIKTTDFFKVLIIRIIAFFYRVIGPIALYPFIDIKKEKIL